MELLWSICSGSWSNETGWVSPLEDGPPKTSCPRFSAFCSMLCTWESYCWTIESPDPLPPFVPYPPLPSPELA
jgi:hypothetical protein